MTDKLGRHTEVYTSFSGSDIVATFGGVPIGACSGITWSVSREKAPLYTMGSPNPRSFTRGKRGIAGSMIFTVFDRPGLYKMLDSYKNEDEIKYFTRSHNVLPGMANYNDSDYRGIVPVGEQEVDVKGGIPYYSDQIPPFDVTITFANEYGQAAVRSIYGVEIINEGSGVSMDDVVIEETMSFVARDIGPMIASDRAFTSSELGDEAPFDETAANFPR